MNLLFKIFYRKVKKQWLFLSTDKVIKTERMANKSESPKRIEGLKLPKNIVDRIFYENTRLVYFKIHIAVVSLNLGYFIDISFTCASV